MRSAWGLMMPHQDWHTRAACTPDTADMFWLSGPATLSVDNRAALTICAGCPVRRQCLDHERDNPQMWSRIAGGVVWLNPRHGSGYAREADPATLAPATRPDPTPQPTPRPTLPDPAPHEPVQPGRILRPHGTAHVSKRYCAPGQTQGARITVREVPSGV